MRKISWRKQTVRQVSIRTGVPEKSLHGAITKGEVKAETFNGMRIITPVEEARIVASLGLAAAE